MATDAQKRRSCTWVRPYAKWDSGGATRILSLNCSWTHTLRSFDRAGLTPDLHLPQVESVANTFRVAGPVLFKIQDRLCRRVTKAFKT
jgi:hypothetical protein